MSYEYNTVFLEKKLKEAYKRISELEASIKVVAQFGGGPHNETQVKVVSGSAVLDISGRPHFISAGEIITIRMTGAVSA